MLFGLQLILEMENGLSEVIVEISLQGATTALLEVPILILVLFIVVIKMMHGLNGLLTTLNVIYQVELIFKLIVVNILQDVIIVVLELILILQLSMRQIKLMLGQYGLLSKLVPELL